MSPYNEWDVLHKAVRAGVAVDPRTPPTGSKGINVMLQEARARLVRLMLEEVYTELVAMFLVDIRPAAQRASGKTQFRKYVKLGCITLIFGQFRINTDYITLTGVVNH